MPRLPLIISFILVLLLAYGCGSPPALNPERCIFPLQFQCFDHVTTTDSVTIQIRNGEPEAIDVKGVSFEGEAINGPCKTEGVTNVLSGAIFSVKASDCNIQRGETDKTAIRIILTYAPSSTPGEEKAVTGELLTRIT